MKKEVSIYRLGHKQTKKLLATVLISWRSVLFSALIVL